MSSGENQCLDAMCQGATNRHDPRCARACLGGACGAVIGGAGGYYAGSSLGAGIGCPLGTATGIICAELMGGGRCRSSRMMERYREMCSRFAHPSVRPAPVVTLTNPLEVAPAMAARRGEAAKWAANHIAAEAALRAAAIGSGKDSGGAGGGGGGGGGGAIELRNDGRRGGRTGQRSPYLTGLSPVLTNDNKLIRYIDSKGGDWLYVTDNIDMYWFRKGHDLEDIPPP